MAHALALIALVEAGKDKLCVSVLELDYQPLCKAYFKIWLILWKGNHNDWSSKPKTAGTYQGFT